MTILLAFVLFSLFFIKDQIDSFQLKKIVVFLKCSVCVYFIVIEFDYRITTDSFRVLQAVETLNIKHELQSKKK